MVGEIRDKETAQLAINAALTGHLVLATLHTNSASGAIPRLLDMGAERFLLSSTLRVIIGQRLVRQLCEKKEEHTLNKTARDKIAREDHFDMAFKALQDEKLVKPKSSIDDVAFYHPLKSAECEDGYSGRIGIHEVLRMSEGMREMMMQNVNTDGLEAQARKEEMMTMLEDGIYKAARGTTSLEEVLRVITE
jgi:type II secretory ATPase GspE/PulE/Tfp pilus assembly ATPase PilB-like protein